MKVLRVLFCTLLAAGMALAQTPKGEFFVGYSYLRFTPGFTVNGLSFSSNQVNMNGWNASLTGNVNRFLGITADFAGQYASPSVVSSSAGRVGVDISSYTFLFGPQVGYRAGKIRPFAHALFGVGHTKLSLAGNVFGSNFGPLGVSDTSNSWASAVGGGVDFALTKLVSVRAGQVDWLRTNYFDTAQNNFRYSGGIVLNLASK